MRVVWGHAIEDAANCIIDNHGLLSVGHAHRVMLLIEGEKLTEASSSVVGTSPIDGDGVQPGGEMEFSAESGKRLICRQKCILAEFPRDFDIAHQSREKAKQPPFVQHHDRFKRIQISIPRSRHQGAFLRDGPIHRVPRRRLACHPLDHHGRGSNTHGSVGLPHARTTQ